MKTILFPTDFSNTANNAFLYALNFANKYDASIIVLHQYDLPTIQSSSLPQSIKEVYDAIEFQNFENLKSHIPHLRKIASDNNLSHIDFKNVLTQGELIASIKDIIKKEEIDAIILGTNGASGLKEVFLGSNASNIIDSVNKLIVSIPVDAKYKDINNIVFTTKFREKDKEALRKTIKIANKFNAKVHVIIVDDKSIDNVDCILHNWQQEFTDDNLEFHLFKNRNVYKTITDFIDSYDVDLITMLHYKKSFIESLFKSSLTQKMSQHSQVPLLSLHEDILS